MPGGNKNIRPEDGKQFSSEYQPEEKWTEAVALQLGKDLIAWQNADPVNMFWDEYLIMERDLYPDLISYLCDKFSSFSELHRKAQKIQEIKLKKYGTADKLNATMTKFVLINNHDWKDRTEIDHSGEIGSYDATESRNRLTEAINKVAQSESDTISTE